MVELHVDDVPYHQVDNKKIANPLLTIISQECPFGGNLSIYKDPSENPLFAFGNDECIFWQFIFTGSSWQPIIP
jgi:hypothetical protein